LQRLFHNHGRKATDALARAQAADPEIIL